MNEQLKRFLIVFITYLLAAIIAFLITFAFGRIGILLGTIFALLFVNLVVRFFENREK